MAEWNETVLWTQAQISNYFLGREEEREEGEIWFSLYIILSVTVCKAKIDAQSHNPASCSLWLYWFQVRVQHYLELWGSTNLKVIMIKYFLSQLELLFWLQHLGQCLKQGFRSLQAASESSLATCVYLTISGLCLESCGKASFLSNFLCSKPIPKMKKGSNWWLDILSFILRLLIKVQLRQLCWNQAAKNAF